MVNKNGQLSSNMTSMIRYCRRYGVIRKSNRSGIIKLLMLFLVFCWK